MNGEIDKILEEFDGYYTGNLSKRIIWCADCGVNIEEQKAFLKQSLQQIAEQAVESCIPEELKPHTLSSENADEYRYFCNGYSQAIKDMRKNRDNYLKEEDSLGKIMNKDEWQKQLDNLLKE